MITRAELQAIEQVMAEAEECLSERQIDDAVRQQKVEIALDLARLHERRVATINPNPAVHPGGRWT